VEKLCGFYKEFFMKRSFSWIFLAAVTTMIISAWPGFSLAGKQPQAVEVVSAQSGGVLGVVELMKNVDRYRGSVRLEGVVSAVAPEVQALSLIDAKEFQTCGVVTCAQLTLPVRWTGPMPSPQDIIRLEGEVQQVSGKLIFKARALKKIPPMQKEAK
jgi:hypothetical protein